MIKLIRALAVVCILAGGLLVLYPYAVHWLERYRGRTAAAGYEQQFCAEQRQEQNEEELRRAEEYNQRLASAGTYFYDPFTEEQPEAEEYLALLNADENGLIGYLEIPSLSLNLAIYHGTSDDKLKKGCGHLAGSSLPVGGCPSHVVLCGHTGQPSARLFTDIDQLEKGDTFSLLVFGRRLEYEVDSIQKLLPEELEEDPVLGIQEGQDQVTLLTCTPYGINSHRLLVHGRRRVQ